ncbi:MAG: hypothetical protein DWQ34_17470 [Planctomycetota bacterium]|nr:MAG: hypothetical protein DWQ34_17470 [Planctomycetota bacterium]REK28028.1 MAG: hypothetical protein DWQ41_06345 [Planctomycetota bacterium]REK37555.1 MAG: hypothetical protein DWQ45_06030 [Planctomycetota bacterium]
MNRKQYRCEARSVAGFVAQIVRYVASGHYFYVRVLIPEHKEPRLVDEKLLRLYDIARPAWRRERRRLKRSAGIHYLRYDRLAVIMLTKGRHDQFYQDHGRSVADIRRQALKVLGYSIRLSYSTAEQRTKVFIRLDEDRYRELKNHFITMSAWESFRDPLRLEREFRRLPVLAYDPVFDQLVAIARQVNRTRRRRGFAPIRLRCLPCKVQPTKVFTEQADGLSKANLRSPVISTGASSQ